ncbi:MAG: acetyltransferase [Alphaproteobacteria bacterium]|uniref:Acetyltransferase n=1 Tax=Candidatus Nitrobium versatile TaxID=2884831 RepID=A0A953J5P6_9BACT|nr:acetyltransferase [Candidatus Nitrobium versatile]
MILPVIIIGGGGHAKVLLDTLYLNGIEVLGIVEADPEKRGKTLLNTPIIGGDDAILIYEPGNIELVNGIGSVNLPSKRRVVFDKFKEAGFAFAKVIHPSAVIASDAEISEGIQIMAGAVIQPGCRIGKNAIINTKVSIDHDCLIDNHVHIAPGVTVSGGVRIGTGAHVGAGTTIIQGVNIGSNCVIGAGSLVIRDIPDGAKVMGVPAY